MVKAAHSKSREELSKMKVGELKALIKKHNLHNQIKGYSKMKKAGLVEALVKHSSKDAGSAAAPKKAAAKFEKKFGNMPSKKEKVPKRKLQPKKKKKLMGDAEMPPPDVGQYGARPSRRRGRPKRLVEE